MFNLTESPEFMAELRRALAEAAKGLDLGVAPVAEDPAHVWLTAREAIEFLRSSKSAFYRFLERHRGRVRISVAVGTVEPRYQLLSLQAIMQQKASGGDEPELGLIPGRAAAAVPRSGVKGIVPVRGVVLRMAGANKP